MEYEHITTEYVSEEVGVAALGDQFYEGLLRGSRFILYVFMALLPLGFIPWQGGVEYGREITFGVFILCAGILWLLSILTKGEIRWRHSFIVYAALLLAAVFGLSAAFSKAPLVSLIFAEVSGEKFATLILGIVAMVLFANIMRSSRAVGVSLMVLILSSAVLGVLGLIHFFIGFSLYGLIAPFSVELGFNPVGTVNGLALFYAALLMMGMWFLVSYRSFNPLVRYLLLASLFIFFANIFFINFRISWIVLLGTAIVLFSFLFRTVRTSGVSFGYLSALGLIAVSIVMLLIKTPLVALQFQPEAAPSLRSTVTVTKAVFAEGPKSILLGSGPGTFGLDWNLYKPSSVNQSLFWNIRFNQGFSWFATLVPTTGVLGALSFLIFLAVSLFLFLKVLLFSPERKTTFSLGLFLGFAALALGAFLYAATLTLVLTLFIFIGLLSSLLTRGDIEGGSEPSDFAGRALPSWGGGTNARWLHLDLVDQRIGLESPWALFLSSLILVSLLSFGIAALYWEVGRVRSVFAQQDGVRLLQSGDITEALERFGMALEIEGNNFRVYQNAVQMQIQHIQKLIGRASGGENVQQEFQAAVASAVSNSDRAVALHPVEPGVWRTRGALYELLIPFFPGVERLAFENYRKAAEFDPLNPSVYSEWGRAGLAYADRLRLLVGQTRGPERVQVEEARIKTLDEVVLVLNKAVELKPDFATAHFLLSQAAIRANNIQFAIASTENAKQSAPFDIGIAFQLGLLYYQNGDFDRAKAEFERTVVLNTNYSNARYFLGLIYDRNGDRDAAIVEFERIEALNPANEEVKRILLNLRRGGRALEGIVPPAEPPETRQTAPVPAEEIQP
ncbi:MAG: hypothetical protein A3C07_02515 [Candidatus Sungbacteria bacterium RIFCSPHIGHO2_02_FULL_47_11]|uniref:Uncharacterized protein n=1 Tax=Candidatus Sungbacteria bacterium RIFCSPHIGHO2_02_FULL_47_11 TaxID=1802270 RepID=A0A1G2KMY2_9BACT|nr:MAG: hypothetical protein A3C07_02515 [Candidatus Sungbacteria bacterium RIFCSPHIGHO2_02_FULL_47_11]